MTSAGVGRYSLFCNHLQEVIVMFVFHSVPSASPPRRCWRKLAPQKTPTAGPAGTRQTLPPGHRHQRQPAAGRHAGNGMLNLELRANAGLWRPQGEAGPALRVEAFAEGSSPLSAPSAIRVPEGTEMRERPQRVGEPDASPRTVRTRRRGVRTNRRARRETARCDSRSVVPGPITTGRPRPGCRCRSARGDTQLSGAFMVDAPGPTPADDASWSSPTGRT